jgi:CheY-like chemotaxis protein
MDMEKHSYVMMIDDDQSIIGIIRRVLDMEGYAESSANAREILARLDKAKPNLVIMDVETPEFDNPETLAMLDKSGETPIIMLTARCEVTTLKNALSVCTSRNRPSQSSHPELTVGMLAKMKNVIPQDIATN